MGDFKIKRGIKIPKEGSRDYLRNTYEFWRMSIGDCYEIPQDVHAPINAQCAASNYKRRNPGWDYTARKIPGGVRIWRIR